MKVVLARPRGFCAGVERAIKCVEGALDRYGPPVYVFNDIVHNARVVRQLAEKGAVFVKDLNHVPPGSHLLFSAHGVGPEQWEKSRQRDLKVVDATCPLVSKVHREARQFAQGGYTIILIGEAGHDEVVGTKGYAPDHIKVVFTTDDVDRLEVPDPAKVAFLTQTTLSVQDCGQVIQALKRKFPNIVGPQSDDICYATQNRQAAVNELAPLADLVLVVGDRASANSSRLAAICKNMGKTSYLISSAEIIRKEWLEGVKTILITAGASAPESLVEGVVKYLQACGPCEVEERVVVEEDVHFKLPPTLG